MTETSFVPSDDERQWLNKISRSRHGQNIRDHVSCLNFLSHCKVREDSLRQVLDFRRVFVHSLAANDQCLGLPRPLPKVVLIYNFSGERGIAYSNNAALVRTLCLVGPSTTRQMIKGVEAVINKASVIDSSILLCYSLPWQLGVQACYWEARTISRAKDGAVTDAYAFSSSMDAARNVATTQSTMGSDLRVLTTQCKAFAEHYCASSIDAETDDGVTGETSHQDEKLRSLIAVLSSDRKKLTADIKALKENHAEALANAGSVADDRVAKIIESAKNTENSLNTKIKELTESNAENSKQNAELLRKIASVTREKNEIELLHATEIGALKSSIKLSNASTKSVQDQLVASEKHSKRESERVAKLEAATNTIIDGLERRLSSEQLQVRTLQAQIFNIEEERKSVAHAMDVMRTEREFAQFQAKMHRRRALGLKCVIAVAAHKAKMLKEAIPPKKMTTDAECMTAPMQIPDKFTNLEIEIAKLHDERDAWTREKSELEKKIAEQPEPIANGHVDTTKKPDLVSDVATELVINNAMTSLTTLVELTRQGHTHARAAETLYNELSTLKAGLLNGFGAQMPIQWNGERTGYTRN